jgi:hypothetical protein
MGFVICSPYTYQLQRCRLLEGGSDIVLSLHIVSGQLPALKKKLLQFAIHHDDGIAEPYQCQLLWVVQSASSPNQNSKGPTLDTVLDVGLSEENLITSNKKKRKEKVAPSAASVNEEQVLPFPQLNVAINLVATGVTQADIEHLETKLVALYEHRLSQYKE